MLKGDYITPPHSLKRKLKLLHRLEDMNNPVFYFYDGFENSMRQNQEYESKWNLTPYAYLTNACESNISGIFTRDIVF